MPTSCIENLYMQNGTFLCTLKATAAYPVWTLFSFLCQVTTHSHTCYFVGGSSYVCTTTVCNEAGKEGTESCTKKRSLDILCRKIKSRNILFVDYLSLNEFLRVQHLFLKRRTCPTSDSPVFLFSREAVNHSLKSSGPI